MNPNQPGNDKQEPLYDQPVAYDKDGRPLYAHPPSSSSPTVVHMSRSVNPIEQDISPEVAKKHEQSKKQYPMLNLSNGEFIISAVRRHPIGMVIPATITILLIAMILGFLIQYDAILESAGLSYSLPPATDAAFPLFMLALAIALGGFVYVYVYLSNKFFLTNESVIQEIQHSLFSRNEQTVSLANIEDASFTQKGVFQQLFNYGSIRLSTEGDETTYRFDYVSNPKQQIAILNNAVEDFKNGRPVTALED